jgi:hypothetical protein
MARRKGGADAASHVPDESLATASGKDLVEPPSHVADPAASGHDDSSGRTSGRPARRKKRVSILRKSWRPVLLFVIMAVCGGYGLHYKALSSPDDGLSLPPPVSLDIFFTSRNVSASLTDTATAGDLNSTSNVGIQLQVPANTKLAILVLSTAYAPGFMQVRVLQDGASKFEVFPENRHIGEREYGVAYTLAPTQAVPRDVTLRFGPFYSSNNITLTKDTFYISLPEIGFQDYGLSMIPSSVLVQKYNLRFYAPRNLDITEGLSGANPLFENWPIKQITPGGAFDGEDYVWHDSGELEPSVEATYELGVAAEGNSAFLSGILFGLSGAAAIALIQEFPEIFPGGWLPTFKRRRMRSKNRADGADVAKGLQDTG